MLSVQRWVNQQTCVVAEGETQTDVFSQLASMDEVFGEKCCAKCKNNDLKFVVRKASKGKKEFNYFELRCKDSQCRAKLSFGQGDGGMLFPVRFEREQNENDEWVYKKDENDRLIPKGTYGWVIYSSETGKEE